MKKELKWKVKQEVVGNVFDAWKCTDVDDFKDAETRGKCR